MAYEAKNYEKLLGIPGISDNLLKNHFTLYQGYVTNTNKLIDSLMNLFKESKTSSPEFAELKRRFAWEFNGMRLHELYFDNIKKNATALKNGELKKSLEKSFGSYEEWEKSFKATGTMRGIGWVILAYDPQAKQFFNLWINEHDVGHLVGTIPLLVMDVFEHAYMLDYGLKKADYIETFFKNIDWQTVEKRFQV